MQIILIKGFGQIQLQEGYHVILQKKVQGIVNS